MKKLIFIGLLVIFTICTSVIAAPIQANLSSTGYTTAGGNPFVNITPRQCTWYAWGRAFEKTGIKVQFSQNSGRNGGAWYDLVTGLAKGSVPQPNSLVSFAPTTTNSAGHIAYIEEVNGDSVVLSEANVNTKTDYTMRTIKISQLNSRSGMGKVNGYIYLGSVTVKDFWVKSAPIVANQTNGFDSQFKLINSSSSTQTFAKVVLAIHDEKNNWVKDMKTFSNVSIAAGATWQTNIVATNSPNAGNYFVVAKVAKTGADWVHLDSKPFTVTAANQMASVKVACPATRLNVAQTSTCSATAYYSNGSNKPVTSTASTSWATNNSNAVTVTTQGVVTAKGAPSDTKVAVTASYKEGTVTQQGSADLIVAGLDGKLPADFGCTADQQTVASKAITGGSIVLMFSKKCGTNWARAITTNSTVATTVKISRVADNKSFYVSGKGTISTPMVYSPSTKACASGKIGSVSVADNTVCR